MSTQGLPGKEEEAGASPHDPGRGEQDPDQVSSAVGLDLHSASRKVKGKELGYQCCSLQGGLALLKLNPAPSLSSWGY